MITPAQGQVLVNRMVGSMIRDRVLDVDQVAWTADPADRGVGDDLTAPSTPLVTPATAGASVLSCGYIGNMSPKLEGVWKGGPPGFDGITIMTATHYCSFFEATNRTRFEGDKPTEAEAAAAFHTMVAGAGTYRVSGSTVTLGYEYDRPPHRVPKGPQRYEYSIDGDTLTMTHGKHRFIYCRVE